MDLLLWRHADARDAREGEADADRPLTPKGERQAQRMARWLNLHLPEGTRVLVSPALRTRQTAIALDRKFRIVDDLAPESSVESLLGVTRWPDGREPVLVVGHQPTLGMTAAYLLSGMAQAWTIRKGGVWWIRRRVRDGRAETLLHAALTSEQV